MASYGIMRIEKRGRSAIYGLQIEANRKPQDHQQGRDFDNSDIDWAKTKDNIHIIHTVNWNKEITKQIKENGLKERKDSIVLLDALYTCSPEWIASHSKQELLEYFRDCLHFHIKEYCAGDKSKIINATIHLDEKTPHLHIASIPIVEDEKGAHLSAKIIMGGRDDFRLRQDRFFNEVSSRYGMERGEQREPAETKMHTTKREWQIEKQQQELNMLEDRKTILEFDVQVATSKKNYELKKAEEAKAKKETIQAEIAKLENENNELIKSNESIYNRRYEEVKKFNNERKAVQNLQLQIKGLEEQKNRLQEYVEHNTKIVKDWKNEATDRMNSLNDVLNEWEDFVSEAEQRYQQELMQYAIRDLGLIPEEPSGMDFDTPTTTFNNYDEEEYEL